MSRDLADLYAATTDHLPDDTCHKECEPQCPSN